MNWRTKAKIFRVFSRMPLGTQIHFLLQRYVTKEWPRRPDALDQLLVAAQRIVKEADGRIDRHNSHFIEIGAGRDLAVAIGLRLLGVKKITCVDVSLLAKPCLVAHAARYFAEKLGAPIPKIETWNDVEAFWISYVAPSDIVSLKHPSQSIDCFYSIDTLEHIPYLDLKNIFTEVRRILKPRGVAINFIDYSDHYARGSDISRFNFLTFSEEEWKPFNSSFQYVNRMRHSEFLRLFTLVGFKSLDIEIDVEETQPHILENLSADFQRFSTDDLFTIRSKIVASPIS